MSALSLTQEDLRESNGLLVAGGFPFLQRYATRHPPFAQSKYSVVVHRVVAVRLTLYFDGRDADYLAHIACNPRSLAAALSFPVFSASEYGARRCQRCFS